MIPLTPTSQNLYAIAELAQYIIKARAKSHSWTIESFPGKVKLPGIILKSLPSAEAANEVCFRYLYAQSKQYLCAIQILKTVYLPESVVAWLAEKNLTGAERVSVVTDHDVAI